MARRRSKIRYCYEDYINTLSETEQADYQQQFGPLIDIMDRAESDKEIMALAKTYDKENGSSMFEEAVHLTVYCIACSKFDCDC